MTTTTAARTEGLCALNSHRLRIEADLATGEAVITCRDCHRTWRMRAGPVPFHQEALSVARDALPMPAR